MNPYVLSLCCLMFLFFSCQEQKVEYLCKPCDLPCDTIIFNAPGTCPHCGMELILKSKLLKESQLIVNEVDLELGSGVFLIEGGRGDEEKTISVFYHKPQNFSKDSKILMVIPGAGRNGDSYRDAWVEKSEKYSILVLSPMYPEEDYGFTDYHLAGLIQDSNLRDCIEYVEHSNIAKLNEDQFNFKINTNAEE